MDGPYRDLGAGFARLTGVEGARRGPSRITHVEDALLELARNAREVRRRVGREQPRTDARVDSDQVATGQNSIDRKPSALIRQA